MPKKLTKHQRQYRKRKKESEKDFVRVKKDGLWDGVRVARRRLKVWISQEAYDRLQSLAQEAGIHNWEMLSRMILKALPRYASFTGSASPVNRYSWSDALLNPQERTVRYKGSKGEKQLSYDITSTAWKKLECHKTASRLSKARIVESMISEYKPLSPKQLEKQRLLTEEAARGRDDHAGFARIHRDYNHSKLLDVGGGVIIHGKGIPMEHWDAAEWEEYAERKTKSYERKLKELRDEEKEDTDEYRWWLRQQQLWEASKVAYHNLGEDSLEH
jgi:DNA-binding transcriptional regulator/RsmH inhibitor MraZ